MKQGGVGRSEQTTGNSRQQAIAEPCDIEAGNDVIARSVSYLDWQTHKYQGRVGGGLTNDVFWIDPHCLPRLGLPRLDGPARTGTTGGAGLTFISRASCASTGCLARRPRCSAHCPQLSPQEDDSARRVHWKRLADARPALIVSARPSESVSDGKHLIAARMPSTANFLLSPALCSRLRSRKASPATPALVVALQHGQRLGRDLIIPAVAAVAKRQPNAARQPSGTQRQGAITAPVSCKGEPPSFTCLPKVTKAHRPPLMPLAGLTARTGL